MKTARAQAVAIALHNLVEKEGRDPKEVADSGFAFLQENNLEHLSVHVIRHLEAIAQTIKEEHTLEIRVAHEMNASMIRRIAKKIDGSDKTQVRMVVDRDVIGGFRARLRGVVYDASVRGALEALRKKLLHA